MDENQSSSWDRAMACLFQAALPLLAGSNLHAGYWVEWLAGATQIWRGLVEEDSREHTFQLSGRRMIQSSAPVRTLPGAVNLANGARWPAS